MKDFVNTVTQLAEKLDWSVNSEKDNKLTLSKRSPSGTEFDAFISFTILADNLADVVDALIEYCDSFDCSEETYLWLDSSGHGINGAPYDMKDVYEDMEACLEIAQDLLDEFQNALNEE